MTGRKTAFERRCEAAAEKAGVDVSFADFKAEVRTPFEDDGTFHITSRSGQRAWFWVHCDIPETQNERAKTVLDAMGITKYTSYDVFTETEDEEECPHCGRPYCD